MAKQRSRFIDPNSCGSFVGWRLYPNYDGVKTMSIKLGDCSRSIEWDIRLDRAGIKKLGAALDVLSSAYSALLEEAK